MSLIFEDSTRMLRRCFFDVHNEVGIGYPEEAYHRAFLVCCRRRDLPVLSKQAGRLEHRGRLVHTFQFDVMAENIILLELKALPGGFARDHFVQIISYLKFWKRKLGLLVNFGQEKVKVERVPFMEKALELKENYEQIRPLVTRTMRPQLRSLRAGILDVGRQHGLGYGGGVCAKLLGAEWQHRGFPVREDLSGTLRFEGEPLGRFPVDALLIGENVLCCVTALKDNIGPYELGKAQGYLRVLDLPIGLVVNFGKHALQICGVRPPKS